MIDANEKNTIFLLVIGLVGGVACLLFSQTIQIGSSAFPFFVHSLFQIISISFALAIAIQAWMVFPYTLSKRRLIWGALFLSVGIFDLLHVLFSASIPYFGRISNIDEMGYWWLSRFTLSIGSLFFFNMKEKEIQTNSRQYIFMITIIYIFISSVAVLQIFGHSSPLFTGNLNFSVIHTIVESTIILFFIIVIIRTIRLYKETKKENYLLLLIAFVFSLYCDALALLNTSNNEMIIFYIDFYKIISFFYFTKGIYEVMIKEPFMQHKETQVALKESKLRLEEIVKEVNYTAFHDELTGLPNRNYLLNHLEDYFIQVKKNKEKFALISINLNRFKNVNDTLGNEMGDLFLKTIAERLKELKKDDAFLARMVADEFMIVMENQYDIEELIQYAYTIHKRLEEPMIAKGFKFYITSSIGITVYQEKMNTIDQMIKQVQLAMHEAKKSGQAVMLYHPDMNKELFENILLENDLRQALSRKELILYYQPQVNIDTGEIIGVEALIRWNHREKGMISPAKFIPLAEETGLIIPIGNWVIEEACRQLKKWQEQGIGPLRLSINISLRQIFQKDLVEIIEQALKKTDINPACIELEITESIAVNSDRVITILQSLKKLGVRISVDDFGTGYSSLSYLYSFPIDQLKIDRSFISNLFHDNNKVIVSTIISMGKNLGLELIAEGVETPEQMDFLRSYQCIGVQGYLISRPLPPDQMESLLCKKTVILDHHMK